VNNCSLLFNFINNTPLINPIIFNLKHLVVLKHYAQDIIDICIVKLPLALMSLSFKSSPASFKVN